uniref:Reverse transcriptase domain-containing protein n=1 Tax=Trichobilharzia regenti TaxID=157069 RepID=A0AA85JZI7_TRIRE|nr:unnamed protein product [Trichobilharzia regenti]
MNSADYEKKAIDHLNDGPYEKFNANKSRATLNKLKAETSKMLQSIKEKLGVSLWFTLAPKSCSPCRFYGLPKIHKPEVPLRPVVDFTNSPTYKLSKYIYRILSPYEMKVEHGVKNSYEFKRKINLTNIEEDEIMASFDVYSLFTNVPVNDSLSIIYNLLCADDELSDRCPLNPDEIMKVLELCLKSTLFTFRGVLYRQIGGIAMGSPVSPLVANLFMHSLETNAIMRCLSPPKVWLRYVDDTFIITKRRLLNELFQLINNMSETIKFSKEVESDENELAFLDCLVKRKLDGKFKINIFRKPTNSDRYLD